VLWAAPAADAPRSVPDSPESPAGWYAA
jgi:hypothetical protein